jgi:hypothetical protein
LVIYDFSVVIYRFFVVIYDFIIEINHSCRNFYFCVIYFII